MPPGRRERRRAEMRDRLLTSALSLFAAHGFDATTIDQIAEHADVARQTVLNHYPAKRDFVSAWGERRRQALEALSIAPDDEPGVRTRLERLYRALAEINEDERGLTRTINHLEQIVDTERPVPEALLQVLARAREDGTLVAAPTTRVIAEILTAVYFDTLSRWLVPESAPFDLGDELMSRVDVVLAGVLLDGRGARTR